MRFLFIVVIVQDWQDVDHGRHVTSHCTFAFHTLHSGDKTSPDENKRGIIPNAFQHIFNTIDGSQGLSVLL